MDACVDGAIELGYTLMVLDTANKWHAARSVYEKKGFTQCKPYFTYNFDPDDPALKNGIVPLFYSMSLRKPADVVVRRAECDADYQAFKRTAEMYAQWIFDNWKIDVNEHQAFEAEMASLPAPYAPDGVILLAEVGHEVVGAVAAKPLTEALDVGDAKVIEMKRLFVSDKFRGHGIGRKLVRACVERARALGYTLIVLDTNIVFVSANALYTSCGFTRRSFYLPGQEKVPVGEMLAYEMPLRKPVDVVVRRAESDADIEAFKTTAKAHAHWMWNEFEYELHMCPLENASVYEHVRFCSTQP